jgi:polyvinyl alcohol dehydrogenase (cytochrome)
MQTKRLYKATLAVLAAIIAVAGCASAPAEPFNTATYQESGDWTMWMKNAYGSRYNGAEHQITPQNVKNLKVKWAYTFANVPYSKVGSQPAIVDGVAYVGGPDAKLFALDARTGRQKWAFDLTPTTGPVTGENAEVRDGPTVSGNSVFFGDSTGRVYSVDKRNGRLNWATQVANHPDARLTSSPQVFDGKVFIGESSYEGGFNDESYPCCIHRGQVISLDAKTGRLIWRYYTMREAEQIGTWPSGTPKWGPSGGGVWASPVIDPRSRTLYVGTGNNYTGFEGDTDSMLALSVDTGRVKWKRQFTHPDEQTYMCVLRPEVSGWCPGYGEYALNMDVGATANLIDVNGRTLVTVGQKGGMYHALDARTGAVVWERRLVEPDLHSKDPGSQGIEFGSSYDGKYIYVSTWRGSPGKVFKLDPRNGKVLWVTENPSDGCTSGGAGQYPNAGCEAAFIAAVSTTPGLVYAGSSDGKERILSAKDGKILWTFDVVREFQGVNGIIGRGNGVAGNGGAVISHGMLYVMTGYHPYYDTSRGPVLLAFGL